MGESGIYFRRRLQEELVAAARATGGSIARIHEEMASRYRDLLNEHSDAEMCGAGLAQPVGGQLAETGPLDG